MSEYPSYLIHFGIPGQKWGVRRFQNEDGTLTPEGIRRYSDLLDKSEKSDKYKKKLDKFERKTDLYGDRAHDSGFKNKKEQLRASRRFDNENVKKMHEIGNNASDKRQEGKNPMNDVKKYVNTSLETATKFVNGDQSEAAQKIVQEYMNRAMNGLNYKMWEIGDFNSYNEHPTKYNQIDYSYDVKNKKLHQKKWKSDWK